LACQNSIIHDALVDPAKTCSWDDPSLRLICFRSIVCCDFLPLLRGNLGSGRATTIGGDYGPGALRNSGIVGTLLLPFASQGNPTNKIILEFRAPKKRANT
jgi:hypothetical protein